MKLISIVSTDEMRDWINWSKCYTECRVSSTATPIQAPGKTTNTVIVSNELHFVSKGFIWTRRLLQREFEELKTNMSAAEKRVQKIFSRVFRCMAHDLHRQKHTHGRASARDFIDHQRNDFELSREFQHFTTKSDKRE